jgi:tRNA(fMet)-specific endonuclease VapC
VTARYLLDTNVLSEISKPAPDAGVLRRFRSHELHVATASLVWNELLFGCQRLPSSRRRDTILAFVDQVLRPSLPVLPYDTAAAEWHAVERVRLEKAGTPRPFVDGQVAAIAHVNGLVLVTANVKDFRFFRSLTVEDWRA